MVIYADTLVFTNIIVDYIILTLTSLLVKRTYSVRRLIPAAVIGGLSSLYILVETDLWLLDMLFKLISGAVVLIIATGFKNIKTFLYAFTVFSGISFALNGLVTLLSNAVNSNVFLSKNMVSYINISPLYLIGATAVMYITVRLLQRIADRRTEHATAELKVEVCGNLSSFTALVDSGNNICDPLSDAQVFVIDPRNYEEVISDLEEEDIARRSRIIPIKTVSESSLLSALRCDRAEVLIDQKRTYNFNRPIIAAASVPIENGFSAIIPKTSLDRYPD